MPDQVRLASWGLSIYNPFGLPLSEKDGDGWSEKKQEKRGGWASNRKSNKEQKKKRGAGKVIKKVLPAITLPTRVLLATYHPLPHTTPFRVVFEGVLVEGWRAEKIS